MFIKIRDKKFFQKPPRYIWLELEARLPLRVEKVKRTFTFQGHRVRSRQCWLITRHEYSQKTTRKTIIPQAHVGYEAINNEPSLLQSGLPHIKLSSSDKTFGQNVCENLTCGTWHSTSLYGRKRIYSLKICLRWTNQKSSNSITEIKN